MRPVIRVVLAHSDVRLRVLIRGHLDAEPDIEVVAEALDGLEAVRVVQEAQPDIALMSMRLPRVNGVDATRLIASLADAPRVLLLTAAEHDETIFEAMRSGASGFLPHDAPGDRLVAALRTAVAGDALVAPAATLRLIDGLVPPADASQRRALGQLTSLECEVLALLGRGLSDAAIGEQLEERSAMVTGRVGRVLFKLGLRDRLQAAVFAHQSGLVRSRWRQAAHAPADHSSPEPPSSAASAASET